jgi:hypothetical protein
MIDNPNKNAGAPAGAANAADILAKVIPAKAIQPDSRFRHELEQIASAVASLILDGRAIDVGGQSTTKEQILGVLQPTLDLYLAVDALVKATQKARLTLNAATPATKQYVKSLKVALQNALGLGNPELRSFGVATGKRRALTVEEKFISAQKSGKTRIVRYTLGKRQKQAVKFQGVLQALALGPPGDPIGGSSATAIEPDTPAAK